MLVENTLHDCWKRPTGSFATVETTISTAVALAAAQAFASAAPLTVQPTVNPPPVEVSTAGAAADSAGVSHPVATTKTAAKPVRKRIGCSPRSTGAIEMPARACAKSQRGDASAGRARERE